MHIVIFGVPPEEDSQATFSTTVMLFLTNLQPTSGPHCNTKKNERKTKKKSVSIHKRNHVKYVHRDNNKTDRRHHRHQIVTT